MNTDIKESILKIVRACENLQLATCAFGKYPETRHIMNAMNMGATDLNLHFLTTVGSPKYEQLSQNPHCCLYYFNPENRHAVRLFGKMQFIDDCAERAKYWRDEYAVFGYTDATDDRWVLMRFVPDSYKFYIGTELKSEKL